MLTANARKDAGDDFDTTWPSDEERERLERILGPYYLQTLEAVNTILRGMFGRTIDPTTLVIDDVATNLVLREAATRVVRIDQATRDAIRAELRLGQLRGYNTWQLAHGVPADGYRGIDGLFQETWRNRALTVARTEIQHASIVASVDRYRASGVVDRVQIIDGDDWDRACAGRNGQTVPLEQAPDLAHPNCTLVLIPVLSEAATAPAPEPPPPVEWGDWKTLRDAEQAAETRYPHIKFDFNGCDLETIDPTLRQFDKLAKQYPQVADRLRYVGTYESSGAPSFPGATGWGANTWAHATRDGKIIGLNPAWYGDPAKLRESLRVSEASKWHPTGCNTLESILTHEFGHQVENWLRSVSDKIAATAVVDMAGTGLVGTTFYRWYQEHAATKTLSTYAAKDKAEGWAEAFAANYHSPSNVRGLKYVKLQRNLLEALDPSKWRHEAGLVDLVAKLETGLAQTPQGSPAREALEQGLARARSLLELTPAGEWRWTGEVDDRMAAVQELDRWRRRFW